MWVKISGRVNYSLKACLIEMQERNEINIDSEHVKFCVSWFTIRVSNVGTTLAVQAWNAHPIPGIYLLVIKLAFSLLFLKVLKGEYPMSGWRETVKLFE